MDTPVNLVKRDLGIIADPSKTKSLIRPRTLYLHNLHLVLKSNLTWKRIKIDDRYRFGKHCEIGTAITERYRKSILINNLLTRAHPSDDKVFLTDILLVVSWKSFLTDFKKERVLLLFLSDFKIEILNSIIPI